MDDELKYLETVNTVLQDKKKELTERIVDKNETVQELKHFITENFYTMDIPEVAQQNVILSEEQNKLLFFVNKMKSLERQISSPYFGMFDFTSTTRDKYYIGLQHLDDENNIYVYDWRAPISSLYYDYELGKAKYSVDNQDINGTINAKRQYRIRNGKLEYYFDSSLTITDEILQEELSKNSSDKMKNIVATIQKEQNKLIRRNEFKNIIVQGVAGSGKTAIALHHASFLLYTNRERLKSEDIMILSPSTAFSSYVENVLPELGEANIIECTFFNLAERELKNLAPLQKREDSLDEVLEDTSRQKTIAFKNSFTYLSNLTKYCNDVLINSFEPKDIRILNAHIKAEDLKNLFMRFKRKQTIATRIDYMANSIAEELNLKNDEIPDVAERVKRMLYSYFPTTNLLDIFNCFLLAQDLPPLDTTYIKYEDIATVLYFKYYMFDLDFKQSIKYLIIDEMQDYSPVEFYLFKMMFPNAPIMLLGDIHQCIEKNITQNYLINLSKMFDTQIVKLNKTYRSTKQITEFSNKILHLKGVELFNRSGKEIEEHISLSKSNVVLEELLNTFDRYNTVAIITKTNIEAREIYDSFKDKSNVELLDSKETYQGKKIIISPVACTKGLEFDVVIIPDASKKNFKNKIERRCLYVACTRALHELHLIRHDSQNIVGEPKK